MGDDLIPDTNRMDVSYWSKEQRRRLAAHVTSELRKLTNMQEHKLFIQVQPEIYFASDERIRKYKGNEQGGWSIWLRETLYSFPFKYNSYIETAIHEAAHAITFQAIGNHAHSNKLFKLNLSRLRKSARELGVWPKEKVPDELKG